MQYDCVTFGEILFDILGDKKEVGGAPFNVAYHLQQLGHSAAMVTRVGNDEDGEALKNFMRSKGLTTNFVQTDKNHETSTVIAFQSAAGEMSYTIKEPVAWDFIEDIPVAGELIKNAQWFIFGSLSVRNKTTEAALFRLLELPVKKVFDINMRPPFVHKERIEKQLHHTDLLKMNEEEFHTVAKWNDFSADDPKEAMQRIKEKYHLETIIVTRGALGAMMLFEDELYQNKGISVNVADTIGSGDAFLAGIIYSFSKKASPPEALDFAGKLGAFVATRSGGTPAYAKNDILSM